VVSRRLGRTGKTRYGCLVGLVILVGAIYYGVGVGAVYLRYFELRDEMGQAARLGRTLDDATLLARLHDRTDSLNVPPEARRFTIRRLERPREIRITSSYTEIVALPFTRYQLHLRPVARAPL
jgi:hypothetical protein